MHRIALLPVASIAPLALALVLVAGCGAESPPTEPAATTSAGDAAAPGASALAPPADSTAADSIPGLPPDAVRLPNEQGRNLWAVKLPSGRVMVYEQLEDGMLSGTGGEIGDLPSIYPGVDFSVLRGE